MKRHEYDSPWKEMLSEYFQEFMTFFFPAASADIHWARGYELLDKELRKIARDAEIGVRFADHLVKVWKTDGEETWVLIHVEVQAQTQTEFPQRMYVYDYRIYDRYHHPVANFAVLADPEPAWRPAEYIRELWGSRTSFQFPIVKILDYAAQWDNLEASPNPFAIVVQAHLKTLETQHDDPSRVCWKILLARELYRRGLRKTDIIKLYRFIDWLMVLPEDLERACFQEIERFEEELRMPYITTAERIGREKGRKEGKLIGEILFAQRMMNLTLYQEEELEQKSLEELQQFVQQFEAKLPRSASQKQDQ